MAQGWDDLAESEQSVPEVGLVGMIQVGGGQYLSKVKDRDWLKDHGHSRLTDALQEGSPVWSHLPEELL